MKALSLRSLEPAGGTQNGEGRKETKMDPRPRFPQLREGATPSCSTICWTPTSIQAWILTRLPPLTPQSGPPLCPGAATASWVVSLLQAGCLEALSPPGSLTSPQLQVKWCCTSTQVFQQLPGSQPSAHGTYTSPVCFSLGLSASNLHPRLLSRSHLKASGPALSFADSHHQLLPLLLRFLLKCHLFGQAL